MSVAENHLCHYRWREQKAGRDDCVGYQADGPDCSLRERTTMGEIEHFNLCPCFSVRQGCDGPKRAPTCGTEMRAQIGAGLVQIGA